MRSAVIVCVVLLGWFESSRANPVSVTIEDKDVAASLALLSEQLEEPVGLLAKTAVPKLGLQQGDLVRAVNGASPLRPAWNGSALHLDVLRAGKPLSVRVAIKLGPREGRLERENLRDRLARFNPDTDHGFMFRQATRNGRPSAVILGFGAIGLFGYGVRALEEGDLIRKIDNQPVATVAATTAALQAALSRSQIVIEAERAGQSFTYTLRLEDTPRPTSTFGSRNDPALDAAIAKVKKIDDTTYLVPRELVDVFVNDPMAVAKGARVVPAMKDGKPVGFKLYAIRPSSPYAALGLTNGDTISAVNDHELTSADKALEVYTKVRSAKSIKLDITRRGKPVTLVWKIDR